MRLCSPQQSDGCARKEAGEQEGAQQSAAFPSLPFCFCFTEQPREHTKRLLSAAKARKVG